MTQRIEISYKTILFTISILVGLWLFVQIQDIIYLVALSVIASSGLRGIVDRLESLKFPRIIAILLIYIVIIALFFVFASVIIPILVSQTNKLSFALADFSRNFSPYLDITPTRITDQLASFSGNLVKATVSIVSSLIQVFTFFALTFYMLLERRHMRVFLRNILGEKHKEQVVSSILKIEDRLGAWVTGELSLMLIIGILTYISLIMLHIEFALPLAILAGVLEIIPLIGPIIAAIPAVIVASLVSPLLAVIVAVVYFVIQQIENHLAVPLVMRRAVGVPPMVSIIAILIGARLAGVIGAVLAVPFFVSAQVIFEEFFSE